MMLRLEYDTEGFGGVFVYVDDETEPIGDIIDTIETIGPDAPYTFWTFRPASSRNTSEHTQEPITGREFTPFMDSIAAWVEAARA